MTQKVVDILMYHSISEGPGPTSISPDAFRRQLDALAESGYRGVGLAEFANWQRGEGVPARKPVVLTFDDGFADFADVACPELRARGWTATVFVLAGKAGAAADFDSWPGRPARQLLSWEGVARLADLGMEIGAHGISHADLTTLSPELAREEIVGSRKCIEDRIGRAVTSFAAPYGRTNPAIRTEIRRHYRAAVSAEFGRARPTSDPHHLPRIEMWYFRNYMRWRAYVEGGARGYFFLRKVARHVRGLLR